MYIVGLFTETFATGGIQRLNRHVCLALSQFAQREGHQVSFLSLMDDPEDVDGRYLVGEARVKGFRGNKAAFVAAAFRELRHHPDVLYATHVNLAPVALVMRWLRPSLRYGVALYGEEVWKSLSLPKRYALQQATFVTSISRDTTEKAVELHGLKSGRIRLVSPALDPFWISAASLSSTDSGLEVPPGKLLLTVARLNASQRWKGVDCVIEAMPQVLREVPDVHYVVVGSGSDLERLQSLAVQRGLKDKVSFVGRQPEWALREYYRNCDIFVMPSRGEGFGIVYLEAMFYKKAVIAGDHGGCRAVVEGGRTGLLARYGDIDGLSEAIVGLLHDDQQRLRIGEAGYERLMDNFTYAHFSKRLKEIVAQVCEEH